MIEEQDIYRSVREWYVSAGGSHAGVSLASIRVQPSTLF